MTYLKPSDSMLGWLEHGGFRDARWHPQHAPCTTSAKMVRGWIYRLDQLLQRILPSHLPLVLLSALRAALPLPREAAEARMALREMLSGRSLEDDAACLGLPADQCPDVWRRTQPKFVNE